PTAVENERRSRHQRRGVGGEKHDRTGDLVELTETAKFDLPKHFIAERLVLEERPRHRRLQKCRTETVDADIARRELDRHCLGETLHRVLGGAIDAAACSADMANLR